MQHAEIHTSNIAPTEEATTRHKLPSRIINPALPAPNFGSNRTTLQRMPARPLQTTHSPPHSSCDPTASQNYSARRPNPPVRSALQAHQSHHPTPTRKFHHNTRERADFKQRVDVLLFRPEFQPSWLRRAPRAGTCGTFANPFGVFSQRGKLKCSPNTSSCLAPACVPASAVCVFVCSSWCGGRRVYCNPQQSTFG